MVDPATEPSPCPTPYRLRDAKGNSDGFYDRLSECADRVEALQEAFASTILDEYQSFAEARGESPPRSRSEYGLELLTLALFRRRYLHASQRTPLVWIWLSRALLLVRSRFPRLKRLVDPLRGLVLGHFFLPALRAPRPARPPHLAAQRRMLLWMNASGEFREEVRRLRGWHEYLTRMGDARSKRLLRSASLLWLMVRETAQSLLGPYTEGVTDHQARHLEAHRFREDVLLLAKGRDEYHLSIVGAELMNRSLRAAFEATARRIVLVPGCMRARSGSDCRAKVRGLDVVCTGCEPACAVFQLRHTGSREGFAVRIVPHSSTFTRWLEAYRRVPATGLIPIACPLHLMAGGYEVRRLGLRAHCVLLDYCGCRQHWATEGVPTAVNPSKVVAAARFGRRAARPRQ